MAKYESLQVRAEGVTLDLLLWRRFLRVIPGLVEQTLDINPTLARKGVVLPIGTRVVVQLPEPPETKIANAVSLWD
jgi:phage tail protein X